MSQPSLMLCVIALLAATGVTFARDVDQLGSVRFDAATHVPIGSAGCGKRSPYRLGRTSVATAEYAGVRWTYRIYMPKTYHKNKPMPLVVQHPGWGMSAQGEEHGAGIKLFADKLGFICVTPQGGDDNNNFGGPWYSWNAVGTTQSPGRAGPTCTSAANHPSYCYRSCGKCPGNPQCDWTTCEETVTPTGTGTQNVGGFIPGLYDTLEEQLCIDTTREFAAGESNGGMMAYQLGVDMASRLAAIAPQFGSFHRGFALAPPVGVAVLDIHGTSDRTVPANVSLSADGYYYTPTQEIFDGSEYSPGWKQSNGCSGPSQHYPTSYDAIKDLWCVSQGHCVGGDVVRCSYTGGHTWFDGGGKHNGGLVLEFLWKWKKPSHIGRGFAVGQEIGPPQLLQNISISDDVDAPRPELVTVFARVMQPPAASRGHYGDPAGGCLTDEDAIPAGTGVVCAPKIGAETGGASAGAPPTPKCRIGGVAPFRNGCPVDADIDSNSKAWPICLAKGNTTDPYNAGEFHCLLVCPCPSGSADCGPVADAHCPKGARCARGELRHLVQGVCTYHSHNRDFSSIVV